jgi:hypothetical protein
MSSIDLVESFTSADLRVHSDPWFWLSRTGLPYWWLLQRAVVAQLVSCGLSPLEIEEVRRGPLPADEVERLGRTLDFDGDTLHVRGDRARPLPLPLAIAGLLEHARDESPHRGSSYMFTDRDGGRVCAVGLIENMQRHAATRGFPGAAARWRRTFLDALAALPYEDGTYEVLRGLCWQGEAPPAEDLREAMMAIHPLGRPNRRNTLVQAIREVPPLAAEIRALTGRRKLAPDDIRKLRLRRFREVHGFWQGNWFDAVAAANWFGVSRSVFDGWVAEAEGRPPDRASAVTRGVRDFVLREFDPERFGKDWVGFHRALERKGFERHYLVTERILRQAGLQNPAGLKAPDQGPSGSAGLRELAVEDAELVLLEFDPARHHDWKAFHAGLQARYGFAYDVGVLVEFLRSKGFVRTIPGIAPQVRARILAEYDPLRFRSTELFVRDLVGLGFAVDRHRLEQLLREAGCEKPMSAWRTVVLAEYAKGGFDDWQTLLDRITAELGFPYCRQTFVKMLSGAGHEPPKPARLDPRWRVEALEAFDAERPRSYQSLHKKLVALGFPYGCDTLTIFLRGEGRILAARSTMSEEAERMVRENYDPARFRSWKNYHAHLKTLGFPHKYYVLIEFVRGCDLPPPDRPLISRAMRELTLSEFDRLVPEGLLAFHRHMQGLGFGPSRETLSTLLAQEGRSFAAKTDWRPQVVEDARRAAPIRNLRAFYRDARPPVSYAALRLVLSDAGVEIPTRGRRRDRGTTVGAGRCR